MLKDSLQLQRLEWVLGFAKPVSKKIYTTKEYKYGVELITRINEECNTFESCCIKGTTDKCFIAQILHCKERSETIACKAIHELISLCLTDDVICNYVYHLPPQTYQFARLTDFARPFITGQIETVSRNIQTNKSMADYYQKRLDLSNECLLLLDKFDEKCQGYAVTEKAAFEANTDAFAGLEGTFMAYKNPEVIPHFPPQYIIGKQVDEAKEIAVHEHELVTVKLYEVKNEWMYSNPTGMFNLSLPEKAHKDSNYKIVTYAEYKENLAVTNDTAAEKASGSESQIELKPNVDPVLLRLEILNKTGKTVKVDVNITSEDDPNVSLPFGGTRA